MTPDLWWTCSGFAIGLLAGALYFGGLWLTVRDIGAASRPGQRLLFSFVVRMGLLLAVFYGLSQQGWPALAAALGGVLVARWLWLAAKRQARPRARGEQ
jgi:F1F0 ATPase subunit 2